MPTEHARLSPSASARWLSCPASVRLVESYVAEHGPLPSSSYADEGTMAHELAEIKAAYAFGKTTNAEYSRRYKAWAKGSGLSGDDQQEMARFINEWVLLLKERLARHPHSQIMLEQRVQTGLESCWGTDDAVIFSPEHVEIIDLKYGAGVGVTAYENSQLMLYGLGALDGFGDLLGPTENVYMTIFQPRFGEGQPSTFKMTATDLRAWRESARPIVEEALYGKDPRFGPSEKACRWCPVAGVCRAQMEKATAEDFSHNWDLLTPEEVGDLLSRLPEIESWCGALRDYAMNAVYSEGKPIPGWKVVRGNGRRTLVDETLAIQRLIDSGCHAEQVANFKARPLGELEKVVGGAKKLGELLGNLLVVKPGNPALVPESDKRDPIDPHTEAIKEFS